MWWCAATILVAACGFTGRGEIAVDAAMPDATSDTSIEQRITIEAAPHHLGDSLGPIGAIPEVAEGPAFVKMFTAPDPCASATLSITFQGPYGPRRDEMPVLRINSEMLPSVRSAFPDDNHPGWSMDADHDWDDQPPITATVSIASLRIGDNVFAINVITPSDDVYFTDVIAACVR